ncbi:hypothetical protein PFAS1_24380 [Pseudomonas frederiksbergensis]|nr:hypothetical protein PFAS1_24380 [Pseudomonas frederiksbergensis]
MAESGEKSIFRMTLDGSVKAPTTGFHRSLVEELITEGLPILPVYLGSSVKMRESDERCHPFSAGALSRWCCAHR